MGNAQVMTAKVSWDNACYWAITALLFFQRRLRQPEFIASIDPLMRRFFVLHARMQQFFRAWDLADTGVPRACGGQRRRRRVPARGCRPSLGDAADRRRARCAQRLEANYALLEALRAHVAGDRRRAVIRARALRAPSPAANSALLDVTPLG